MPSHPLHTRSPAHATIEARPYRVFGGCDYLALSRAPAVLEAVREGIDRFGISVTASRETSGNTAAHDELEWLGAEFFAREMPNAEALLCPDGYLANVAAAQALAATGRTHAVIDDRAHRSLHDAAATAGLEIAVYEHLDPTHAAKLCQRPGGVLMTDGVFSADGDRAPARELLDAVPGDTIILIDDCHGVAACGARGRGSLEGLTPEPDRLVLTTTLAKGVGVAGGLIVAPPALISAARDHASAYICTTPIAPALALGSCAAIRAIDSEPVRLERLRRASDTLDACCAARGLKPCDGLSTPIAAFELPDGGMDELHRALCRAGVIVPLIGYPGGPATRYFRVTVNADHTPADVEALFALIDDVRHGERAATPA